MLRIAVIIILAALWGCSLRIDHASALSGRWEIVEVAGLTEMKRPYVFEVFETDFPEVYRIQFDDRCGVYDVHFVIENSRFIDADLRGTQTARERQIEFVCIPAFPSLTEEFLEEFFEEDPIIMRRGSGFKLEAGSGEYIKIKRVST